METFKFLVQYIVAPLIIAIGGAVITVSVQNGQRNMEKMRFTEQILKDAFDAQNPVKGIALVNLIKPALKDDPAFADSLVNIIVSYYAQKAKEAADTGNVQQVRQIESASKNAGGEAAQVADKMKNSPTINKVEKAQDLELKGYNLLKEGKLEEARDAFKNAEATYPGYHYVYEISRLLTNKVNTVKTDSSKREEEIIDAKKTINEKYSMKLPGLYKLNNGQ